MSVGLERELGIVVVCGAALEWEMKRFVTRKFIIMVAVLKFSLESSAEEYVEF